MAPSNRPRSNSYSSSVKDFHLGTKVRIVETEYVSQRTPQYIGKVGSICEVPVHPATWFKVEFPDGQIITFRPSALKCYDDLDFDDDEKSISEDSANFPTPHRQSFNAASVEKNTMIPTYDTSTPSDENSEDDSSVSNEVDVSYSHKSRPDANQHKKFTNTSLDMVDADKWVGCSVKIIGGKCNGQMGRILKSGNGWIQVLTENNEDVAKRAHELLIISTSSDNQVVYKKLKENNAPSGSTARVSSGGSVNAQQRLGPRKRTHETRDHDDDHSSNELSWRKRICDSININPQYRYVYQPHAKIHACSNCGFQKLSPTSCCWNKYCTSSPLHIVIEERLMDATPEPIKKSDEVKENISSPPVTVSSIMSFTPKNDICTPLMNISTKKSRSDSSITDKEYSPLMSYKCSIYEQSIPALHMPPSSVC